MSDEPRELGDDVEIPSSPPAVPLVPRPMRLSVIALLLGLAALGLAVIPGMAFGRPLPNPFAEEKKPAPVVEPPAEREGGVTFRFRTWSVNFFGKGAEKKPALPPVDPPPELTKDPVHWFTISAVGCALLGIGLASFGHVRERHTPLTVCAMGCCAAAVTWQYFAFGIILGVAAAIALIILSVFGSAMG